MADEDDKVRRNLVVVSGVILGTAFLELPVNGVIDLFANTPDPFKSIPQSKFWAIGLTLLAYLLARYRFSTDGLNMVEVVTNTRKLELRTLKESEVWRALREFNETRVLPPSISALRVALDELHERAGQNGLTVQKPQLEFNEPWNSLSDLTKIPFEFSSEHAKGRIVLSAQPTFSATFTLPQRLFFQCRSILVGYAYSEGAIQQLAPVIFAALAVMTLWFRIASRYLEHWPY